MLDIASLIEITRFYGTGKDFALAGGGNTSVKDGERIAVKASGVSLAGIDGSGFVELSRAALKGILSRSYSSDPFKREAEIKDDLMVSRVDPQKGGRPSVEASLHEMLARRFVVHTHPFIVNALTCSRNAEAETRRLFGDEALFIPYTDPGYRLAKLMEKGLEKYRVDHGEDPRIVLMENHGLVVAAESIEEIKRVTDKVIAGIRAGLRAPLDNPPLPVPNAAVGIVPALRMILSDGEVAKIAAVRNAGLVAHFLKPENRARVSLPFLPDNVVYCKPAPLIAELGSDPGSFLADFPRLLSEYKKTWGYPPKILLVSGLGMVAVEDSKRSAETCLDVFEDLMKVSFLSESFGGPHFLSAKDIQFIETWEVENYRKSVAKSAGPKRRAEDLIALVTGAAQGFGKGIAEGLFHEGANVVIADLNESAGRELANNLNAPLAGGRPAPNRAHFIAADVTSSASLQALAGECVAEFGGLDLLVSNAGVLKAGGLEEMTAESFDFVTRVNYTGYFLCVKHLSPIMKLQHRFRPERFADIIQINSKSGLEGSNKNFAYAGGKFGGIGLTQSFAMELVEHGIKVNSICPGNFFEGPLWSDPEKGLFVQYLRAGKVPGAKSIEEVRRFYESKVLMGRGCRVKDVLRAIFYVVEQEYETGQAIPVTGGQVMLR